MKRRSAVAMSEEEAERYLAAQDRLVLATLRADGRPHLTVMAYHYVGKEICMLSYQRAQKVVNLRRDPRCSCMVDTRGDYRDLKGVELVGTATVADDPAEVLDFVHQHVTPSLFPDEANKTTAEEMAWRRALIRVAPERYVTWDHAKLSGVY